jgi:pyrroline-5-carboxylate reductase
MIVGIIGGGVMGEAISKALLDQKMTLTLRVVEVSSVARDRLSSLYAGRMTLFSSATNVDFVAGLNVLLLAVKPQYARDALRGVAVSKDCVVVSIMAGVTLKTLSELLPASGKIVRAMPNTAASQGKSATVWVASAPLDGPEKKCVEYVLGSMGLAVEVPTEVFIDFGTGLVGSGPAFVFLVVEAFVDAGVHLGFKRDTATELVIQLFEGCVAVMKASPNVSVAQHRWNVTSPGGTTAAGLTALEDGKVRTAIREAVLRAAAKASQLGQGVAAKL